MQCGLNSETYAYWPVSKKTLRPFDLTDLLIDSSQYIHEIITNLKKIYINNKYLQQNLIYISSSTTNTFNKHLCFTCFTRMPDIYPLCVFQTFSEDPGMTCSARWRWLLGHTLWNLFSFIKISCATGSVL